MVGVWWLLFACPAALWCASSSRPSRCRRMAAARRLARTAGDDPRSARRDRPLLWFLLAYWLYIDGVNTIIKMAVDYGLSLGFPQQSLIAALLLTQFVGFPAALAFGWLGQNASAPRAASSSRSRYTPGSPCWAYFLNGAATSTAGGGHRPRAGRHPVAVAFVIRPLVPEGKQASSSASTT